MGLSYLYSQRLRMSGTLPPALWLIIVDYIDLETLHHLGQCSRYFWSLYLDRRKSLSPRTSDECLLYNVRTASELAEVAAGLGGSPPQRSNIQYIGLEGLPWRDIDICQPQQVNKKVLEWLTYNIPLAALDSNLQLALVSSTQNVSLQYSQMIFLVAWNLPCLQVLRVTPDLFKTPVFQHLLLAYYEADDADRPKMQLHSLHTLDISHRSNGVRSFSIFNLVIFPQLRTLHRSKFYPLDYPLLGKDDPIESTPSGKPRLLQQFLPHLPKKLELISGNQHGATTIISPARFVTDSEGTVSLNCFPLASIDYYMDLMSCRSGLAICNLRFGPGKKGESLVLPSLHSPMTPSCQLLSHPTCQLKRRTMRKVGFHFGHDTDWQEVKPVWCLIYKSVEEIHVRMTAAPELALDSCFREAQGQQGPWSQHAPEHGPLRLVTLAAPWGWHLRESTRHRSQAGADIRPLDVFVCRVRAIIEVAVRTFSPPPDLVGATGKGRISLRVCRGDPFAFWRLWEEHGQLHGSRCKRALTVVLADTQGSAVVEMEMVPPGPCGETCSCGGDWQPPRDEGWVSWTDGAGDRVESMIRNWAEKEVGPQQVWYSLAGGYRRVQQGSSSLAFA